VPLAPVATRAAPPIALNGQSTRPSVARFRPASGLTQADDSALRKINFPVGHPMTARVRALWEKTNVYTSDQLDVFQNPAAYGTLNNFTKYGTGYNMALTNRRINKGWQPTSLIGGLPGIKGAKADFKQNSRLGRMGLTVGGSMLLGGISNYAEATGHTGVSTAADFGSRMAMGAAMGMGAGPVGAAIGAAGGALAASFELLTKKATEAAAALATQKAAVYKGQEVDKRLNSYIRDKEDAKQLKAGNVGYFQHQLELATDLNQRQEAQL
jgi:hypothetical protein